MKAPRGSPLQQGAGAVVSDSSSAAEFVPMDRVQPWSGNPRKNAKAIREVARSIRRFGFAAPIVARRENGEIIAGHTRYAAAQRLKLDLIPVRFMDVTEQEAHVLALADNKLGEIAEWDDDKLSDVLEGLEADGVDIEVGTGFEAKEIDKLLGFDGDADGCGGRALSDDLKFTIVVDCTDEAHQAELLSRFEAEGLTVKPVMS